MYVKSLLVVVFSVFMSCESRIDSGKAVTTDLNFIYINADDLGWTDIAIQGSKYYKTPHLDKLSKEGMNFSNAYAPAANCQPSRACILTGQYGPRHGVYTVKSSSRGNAKDRKLIPITNTQEILVSNHTMAQVLKTKGYVSCMIGKWHVSRDPLKHGFDQALTISPYGGGKYYGPFKKRLKTNIKNVNYKDNYMTDFLTTQGIEFIKANKGKKFFLYLAFNTVHVPIIPDKKVLARYQGVKTSKDHNNAKYAAMVTSMDDNVGRLMKHVDDLGLRNNTVVLFSSDNGGHKAYTNCYPLRAGKGSYYEGGIREPLFVRWPGVVKAGSKCDVPVNGVDFFPTFMDIAGAKKPKGKILDGVSLKPLLTQTGSLKNRALYWHFPIYLQSYLKDDKETRDPIFRTRPGSVIRYGDWKLHEYFEDGGLELYNLKADISEKNDLSKSNTKKTKELHAMLKKWRAETKAAVPTKLNPAYKP